MRMNSCLPGFLGAIVVMTVAGLVAGCGSGDSRPSLAEIPRYPNAVERESMAQSMGPIGGQLVQYTTRDSHDAVLKFYADALKDYDTKTMSHAVEGGRQTAISIAQRRGNITVAIQEFVKEGAVNITLMRVGT